MSKEKTIVEKINELNKATYKSLVIAYFTDWQLHSYSEGSLFYDKNVNAKTFKGVVNKAYRIFIRSRETQ